MRQRFGKLRNTIFDQRRRRPSESSHEGTSKKLSVPQAKPGNRCSPRDAGHSGRCARAQDLVDPLLGHRASIDDRSSDQLLIIVRMVRTGENDDPGDAVIEMEQVSMVFAERYVITFQEKYGDVLDSVRKRLSMNQGIIRKRGADYLAYVIADTIIDGYFPVLEAIGDRLEFLETVVLENPSSEVLGQLNRLKNQLINLRRAVWPQREAINQLGRDNHGLVTDEVRVYLRDTRDHCIQTSEVLEMYREMATGLMNTYLSSVANRTNEVMKVLTIMSSIFIPLTFMAGIYGMNFEHMPELKYEYSYVILIIAMILVAAGMLFYFWRKGWIFEQRR